MKVLSCDREFGISGKDDSSLPRIQDTTSAGGHQHYRDQRHDGGCTADVALSPRPGATQVGMGLPTAFLEARFCSGVGPYHSPNARRNPRQFETITGAEIVDMLDDPQQVDKAKARWVIFSPLLSRCVEEQCREGKFYALWVDLDDDPPRVQDIADFLAGKLWTVVLVYTTHGATEGRQKARIIVPLEEACPGDRFEVCQRILNDRLVEAGITPDRSTERANQVCYLPNVGEFYATAVGEDVLAYGGLDWQEVFADELTANDQAEAAQLEKLERRPEEARGGLGEREVIGQVSVIAAFNDTHPLELMLDQYCESAGGGRWLSPLSESGSPGITITPDGAKWHSSHTSDREAGLGELARGGGCWGDAFDLYCHYEHSGDRNAALKAVGDMLITEDGRTITEFNREKKALAALDDVPWEDAKKHRQRTADDHLACALRVVEAEGRENLLATRGAVWRWAGSGVWRKQEDRTIKQLVQRYLARWAAVSRSTVDSVTDLLKTEIHAESHRFDVGHPETINCINGELVYTPEGWRLEDHQRDHYWTAQVPVAYDPEARAPRFERFLGEVFEGDPDADDKRRAVLEMLGYSLMAHCRFESFALLVGNGANGKSVLLRVLAALVGTDRVAGVQPSKFGSSFQRAHLEGKLVNLVSEIRQGEVIDDAALKAIVSGEASTVEHKNRDPFELRPYATCWFGTNHMPHTRDYSDGFFRRALVLEFNRTFSAEDGTADPDLARKLEAELPGILNLAVETYAEALERGKLSRPSSSAQAGRRWRLEADQAAQFIEEECIKDADGAVTVAELFRAYREWAASNGIGHPLTKRSFRDRVIALGFKHHRGTKGVRMIRGLCLRRASGYGLG